RGRSRSSWPTAPCTRRSARGQAGRAPSVHADVGLRGRRGEDLDATGDAPERGDAEMHADAAVPLVLGIEPPRPRALAAAGAELGDREARPLAQGATARAAERPILVGPEEAAFDLYGLGENGLFDAVFRVRHAAQLARAGAARAAGLPATPALHPA